MRRAPATGARRPGRHMPGNEPGCPRVPGQPRRWPSSGRVCETFWSLRPSTFPRVRGVRPARELPRRSGRRQRFSGRILLPSSRQNPLKSGPEPKKKLAFHKPQRHNVTSPGGFDTCRHVARILPGLPSLRRMAQKPQAIPSIGACPSRRGGSFPAPFRTAGLACPLNHTVDTPNSGRVSRHRIPAQAGRWIDLNVGIAKEL